MVQWQRGKLAQYSAAGSGLRWLMRLPPVGHLLFAVGLAVEGALGLAARDFLMSQQPVPDGIPLRGLLACLSAALLLLAGSAMLIPRVARLAALVMTSFMLLWLVALHMPRVVMHPGNAGYWLGAGEVTTLTAGGWLLYCAIAARSDRSLWIARTLFGLALVPIGVSHFVYLEAAANLIPSWFPARVFFTALSGAGHIAAGVAIAFGVLPRLAATLEAGMESLFTLICWGTAVVTMPTSREAWVNLFISTALTGAGWALASSYRRLTWAPAQRATLSVSDSTS